MKTFIFSLPARLKSFNEKLDVKGALCGKSWEVFNDEGVKQLFIFNTDGSLLITLNGKVMTSSWQFIPANSSILITTDNETTMFLPAFYDEVIFALQQDGVERYLFMIDERNKNLFPEITLQALTAYFEEKERKIIEAELRERLRTNPIFLTEEQRKKEKQKDEERTAIRLFLKSNNVVVFDHYKKRHTELLSFSALLIVVGIVVLSVIDNEDLAIVSAISIVIGITIGYMTLSETKADYVINRFEQEVGRKIEHLDKSEIKQLYEEL